MHRSIHASLSGSATHRPRDVDKKKTLVSLKDLKDAGTLSEHVTKLT
jgi:hypothetical protein